MTQLPAHVQEYIDSIESVDYFSGSGPLPEGCKLYETRAAARAAAGVAAWAAARGYAWDAAQDAAWDAAEGAGRTAEWDAVRTAAWVAALAAVRTAADIAAGVAARGHARAAARDAARDAAGDAALLAICLLVQGFIGPKHLAYALMRWAIWAAGYGVAVEVDGVHYCYRRP